MNIARKAHAVVRMDQAGWHTNGKLEIPENSSIMLLPPSSPELNPHENIWQYMRQNWLENRIFDDYSAILDITCEAWNKLIAKPGNHPINQNAGMGNNRSLISASGIAIIDSQSVKTGPDTRGKAGFDAGKKGERTQAPYPCGYPGADSQG